MRTLATWLVLGLVVVGCSADTATKLGGLGEACASDDDCRLEFLCDDEVCGGTSVSPCTDACAKITDECSLPVDRCVGACAEATRGFSAERAEDFASCVQESSCERLRGNPLGVCAVHSCDASCSRLTECGLETYATCTESCEDNTAQWTRREFDSFEECFFRLDCDELGTKAETCFPD